MADVGTPFELAESALAHTIGNSVVQAYRRSSMLERRRPPAQSWSVFVTGKANANVTPIKVRAPHRRA
jgi:hypothetical protein